MYSAPIHPHILCLLAGSPAKRCSQMHRHRLHSCNGGEALLEEQESQSRVFIVKELKILASEPGLVQVLLPEGSEWRSIVVEAVSCVLVCYSDLKGLLAN